jgi:hypothetical protein
LILGNSRGRDEFFCDFNFPDRDFLELSQKNMASLVAPRIAINAPRITINNTETQHNRVTLIILL